MRKASGRGEKGASKNAGSPCSHHICAVNMMESCEKKKKESLAFHKLQILEGLFMSRFL